jgi:hypothetical protein
MMTEKVSIANATLPSDFDLGDEDRTPRKSWKTPCVILPTELNITGKVFVGTPIDEHFSLSSLVPQS